MQGPAHLKRLVLYLNTQQLSIPDVTVIRERGRVVLHNHTLRIALCNLYNCIGAFELDRYGRFIDPIGIVLHEDTNPQAWKLPYFIQRLLGVASGPFLEDQLSLEL